MASGEIRRLRSGDRRVRRKAAEAIGVARDAAAVPDLIKALDDADARVAEEAAEALGKIGDPAAVPALLEALYHANGSTRVGALKALADLRDRSAVGRIIQILTSDPYWNARRHAATALAAIGDPAAVPALRAALAEGGHEKGPILSALAAISPSDAMGDFLELLGGYGRETDLAVQGLLKVGDEVLWPVIDAVRNAPRQRLPGAARVLAGLGPQSEQALLELLADRDEPARGVVIEALGQKGSTAAIPALRRALLEDRDDRSEAAWALGRIGGEGHVVLRTALIDGQPEAREAAVDAAVLLDARTVAAVLDALRNPDLKARLLAKLTERAALLTRLGERASGSGTPLAEIDLHPLLADQAPGVRAAAARAVGVIRDISATEPLIAMLEHEEDVALAAAEALAQVAPRAVLNELRGQIAKSANATSIRIREILSDHDGHTRYYIAAADVGASQEETDTHKAEILPDADDGEDASDFFSAPTPQDEAARSEKTLKRAEPPKPVQLTTYAPIDLGIGAWRDLLCYVHLPSSRDAVAADSQRRRNPEEAARRTSAPVASQLPRGCRITVLPQIPGLTVNPGRQTVAWEEDWHRVDFRVRADPEAPEVQPDRALNGAVEFYVGGLLIGRTAVSIFLPGEGPGIDRLRATPTAQQYRNIFASYSRKDAAIVELMAVASKALGNLVIRDVEHLRTGQKWRRELGRLIDGADMFQLFWSESARCSPNVEAEWRHALGSWKQDFVRPIFWEQPMAPVPQELEPLHFSYLPLGVLMPPAGGPG